MNELTKFETGNKETLTRFLKDYNPGHDDTQIEYFIVGSGVTDYGKYKQAIAEVNTHYRALQGAYIQQKKVLAERAILEAELDELGTTAVERAKKDLKLVEIEEKDIALDVMKKQIERNLNELNKMFQLAEHYEKAIEGKDRKELEKEYHIERLRKLVAVNTIWGGNNLSGVLETATTLPENMLQPILNELHACQLVLAGKEEELALPDKRSI